MILKTSSIYGLICNNAWLNNKWYCNRMWLCIQSKFGVKRSPQTGSFKAQTSSMSVLSKRLFLKKGPRGTCKVKIEIILEINVSFWYQTSLFKLIVFVCSFRTHTGEKPFQCQVIRFLIFDQIVSYPVNWDEAILKLFYVL